MYTLASLHPFFTCPPRPREVEGRRLTETSPPQPGCLLSSLSVSLRPMLDLLVSFFRRDLDTRPETKLWQCRQVGRGRGSCGPWTQLGPAWRSQAQEKGNTVLRIFGFGGTRGRSGYAKAAAALQTLRDGEGGRAWRGKLGGGGARGRDKTEVVLASRGRWRNRNPARQPAGSLPTLKCVWRLPRL